MLGERLIQLFVCISFCILFNNILVITTTVREIREFSRIKTSVYTTEIFIPVKNSNTSVPQKYTLEIECKIYSSNIPNILTFQVGEINNIAAKILGSKNTLNINSRAVREILQTEIESNINAFIEKFYIEGINERGNDKIIGVRLAAG